MSPLAGHTAPKAARCEGRVPFPVRDARVSLSPFARKRGRTTQEARLLVRSAVERWLAGESVGFTYVASLKSMGLIPRADGAYRLGPKYCATNAPKK